MPGLFRTVAVGLVLLVAGCATDVGSESVTQKPPATSTTTRSASPITVPHPKNLAKADLCALISVDEATKASGLPAQDPRSVSNGDSCAWQLGSLASSNKSYGHAQVQKSNLAPSGLRNGEVTTVDGYTAVRERRANTCELRVAVAPPDSGPPIYTAFVWNISILNGGTRACQAGDSLSTLLLSRLPSI